MFEMRPKLNRQEIIFKNKFKNYIPAKAKNKGCKGVHGARECERRKRQILRGQLKQENGLAFKPIKYNPPYKITVE